MLDSMVVGETTSATLNAGFGASIKTTIQAVIDMGGAFAKPLCAVPSTLLEHSKPNQNPYELLTESMQVLKHFDRNEDGLVDQKEIAQRLKTVANSEMLSKAAMLKLDKNDDGFIELQEWLSWCTSAKSELLPWGIDSKAFKQEILYANLAARLEQ